MRRTPALLAVLGLLAGCTATAGHAAKPARHKPTPTPTATPTPTPTPTSVWGTPVVTEDFDGTRLDPSQWIVYDSPTAKVNPRTSAATSVAGGVLRLVGGIYGGKDLSGGVASTYLQTYGRWEVRLRAAAGVGYSPVVLLWPQNMGHPEYAEIDFTEMLDPTRHSAGIFIHHGPHDDQAQHQMRADFTRWHVVAVDWLPSSLTFWLDGKKVWTYRGPLIPHKDKMGLALQNDQVCDLGPSFCRNRTTPKWVPMEVDWVKIYRKPS